MRLRLREERGSDDRLGRKRDERRSATSEREGRKRRLDASRLATRLTSVLHLLNLNSVLSSCLTPRSDNPFILPSLPIPRGAPNSGERPTRVISGPGTTSSSRRDEPAGTMRVGMRLRGKRSVPEVGLLIAEEALNRGKVSGEEAGPIWMRDSRAVRERRDGLGEGTGETGVGVWESREVTWMKVFCRRGREEGKSARCEEGRKERRREGEKAGRKERTVFLLEKSPATFLRTLLEETMLVNGYKLGDEVVSTGFERS